MLKLESPERFLNYFEVVDSISMTKVILFAGLNSVDTMNEISALSYRDSSVLSTDLVKFLSLNTSVEAVYELETQSVQLTGSTK